MTINWTYAGGDTLPAPSINLQTTIPTQSGLFEQYRTVEEVNGADALTVLTAQIDQLTAQLLMVMKEAKLKTDEIIEFSEAGS